MVNVSIQHHSRLTTLSVNITPAFGERVVTLGMTRVVET
jgi:hypothetical protein